MYGELGRAIDCNNTVWKEKATIGPHLEGMVSASALQQLEDDRGHLPCGLLGVMSVFLQFISEHFMGNILSSTLQNVPSVLRPSKWHVDHRSLIARAAL